MQQFLALVTGRGQGCDYTLGCNMRWAFLEATNMEDALKEAEIKCFEEMGREECVKNVLILEVTGDTLLDIEGIIRRREAAEQKKHDASVEERDKQEYARLKEKFESQAKGN